MPRCKPLRSAAFRDHERRRGVAADSSERFDAKHFFGSESDEGRPSSLKQDPSIGFPAGDARSRRSPLQESSLFLSQLIHIICDNNNSRCTNKKVQWRAVSAEKQGGGRIRNPCVRLDKNGGRQPQPQAACGPRQSQKGAAQGHHQVGGSAAGP